MSRYTEMVCDNCGEEFAAVYGEDLCETCEHTEFAADVLYGESEFDRLDDIDSGHSADDCLDYPYWD